MVFGRPEGDFTASYDLKSADVIDGKTATSFLGLRAEDALGIGVGSAGDLNGDGVADVWVRILKAARTSLLGPAFAPEYDEIMS